MRIHYLQHVPFEGLANVFLWATGRGHTVSGTRMYADEPPPAETVDWLVVLGGPMNVYEHDAYPWLVREKEFLAQVVQRGVPVLGICLGAQLLADVLGARVTRNHQTEIGWFPVALSQEAAGSLLFQRFPSQFLPFHWHGDTFSIPAGAVPIASSDACARQAFQYRDRVVGLQFHLEYSAQSIEAMIRHCGSELVDGPFIQKAEDMLACPERIEQSRELLHKLLEAVEG
jgi:GMP synthase-like glutamine amidotransferase